MAWAYRLAKRLSGLDRHARDQLLRASQSVPLNIAEGNGKGTDADRRRFFEIARGSALECAAIQDCLESCGVLDGVENTHGKAMLVRIVSMLTKLGRREHGVGEEFPQYGDHDHDNDNDHDHDGNDHDNDGNDHDHDNNRDNGETRQDAPSNGGRRPSLNSGFHPRRG